MDSSNLFVDYYEMLQVSPNAEQETIQRVFRMLAARYHPDNPHTGSATMFLRLNEAYRILGEPKGRLAYDMEYQLRRTEPMGVFHLAEFAGGIDGEENRRLGILCLLYKQRRTNPDHAGMSILDLENLMSIPREHLMFSLWYLKEKNLVRMDEGSDYVMTAEGADKVEATLPSHTILYNLLKASEGGEARTGESPAPFAAAAPADRKD